MAGFSGKFDFSGRRVERHLVEAMTNALTHRGHDGSGYYFAPGIGIGHRAVIDGRRPCLDQPTPSEHDIVWVAADAALFNARELRAELRAYGHVFRSDLDAEVIAHGYELWGHGVVERLRGAFAFALWDSQHERLVLARDRIGIRPLFYTQLENGLAFASEMKALLEDPAVADDVNEHAVASYVSLGYVPAPETMLKRVSKLPPGHVLVSDRGQSNSVEYWDVPARRPGDARTERECLEHLEALVYDAVKGAATPDAAVLLSGGLKSTAIASARGHHAPPFSTLTTAFDEAPFDEMRRARSAARQLGSEHRTVLVTPRLTDLLPRLAWHLDEPFADVALVRSYYLLAAARDQASVALTGHGGDEVWAGLARHRAERRDARIRSWLGPLAPRVALAARPLGLVAAVGDALRTLELDPVESCVRRHDAGVSRKALARDFVRHADIAGALAPLRALGARNSGPDPLDRVLYVEVKTSLADNLLASLDRVAGCVGLDLRMPLLDHPLVEFAAGLRPDMKIRGGRGLHLLRELVKSRVPGWREPGERRVRSWQYWTSFRPAREAEARQAPEAVWLRGPLAPLASDLLLSGRFRQRGIFDSRTVTRLWQSHMTGRRDNHQALWSMLMLELWFEQHRQRSRHVERAA